MKNNNRKYNILMRVCALIVLQAFLLINFQSVYAGPILHKAHQHNQTATLSPGLMLNTNLMQDMFSGNIAGLNSIPLIMRGPDGNEFAILPESKVLRYPKREVENTPIAEILGRDEALIYKLQRRMPSGLITFFDMFIKGVVGALTASKAYSAKIWLVLAKPFIFAAKKLGPLSKHGINEVNSFSAQFTRFAVRYHKWIFITAGLSLITAGVLSADYAVFINSLKHISLEEIAKTFLLFAVSIPVAFWLSYLGRKMVRTTSAVSLTTYTTPIIVATAMAVLSCDDVQSKPVHVKYWNIAIENMLVNLNKPGRLHIAVNKNKINFMYRNKLKADEKYKFKVSLDRRTGEIKGFYHNGEGNEHFDYSPFDSEYIQIITEMEMISRVVYKSKDDQGIRNSLESFLAYLRGVQSNIINESTLDEGYYWGQLGGFEVMTETENEECSVMVENNTLYIQYSDYSSPEADILVQMDLRDGLIDDGLSGALINVNAEQDYWDAVNIIFNRIILMSSYITNEISREKLETLSLYLETILDRYIDEVTVIASNLAATERIRISSDENMQQLLEVQFNFLGIENKIINFDLENGVITVFDLDGNEQESVDIYNDFDGFLQLKEEIMFYVSSALALETGHTLPEAEVSFLNNVLNMLEVYADDWKYTIEGSTPYGKYTKALFSLKDQLIYLEYMSDYGPVDEQIFSLDERSLIFGNNQVTYAESPLKYTKFQEDAIYFLKKVLEGELPANLEEEVRTAKSALEGLRPSYSQVNVTAYKSWGVVSRNDVEIRVKVTSSSGIGWTFLKSILRSEEVVEFLDEAKLVRRVEKNEDPQKYMETIESMISRVQWIWEQSQTNEEREFLKEVKAELENRLKITEVNLSNPGGGITIKMDADEIYVFATAVGAKSTPLVFDRQTGIITHANYYTGEDIVYTPGSVYYDSMLEAMLYHLNSALTVDWTEPLSEEQRAFLEGIESELHYYQISVLIENLGSEDQAISDNAFEQLKAKGSAAVPQLIISIQDSDPVIQILSIVLLGEIGDERALDPLVEILPELDRGGQSSGGYYSYSAQGKAVLAIGEIAKKGSQKAIDILQSIVNGELLPDSFGARYLAGMILSEILIAPDFQVKHGDYEVSVTNLDDPLNGIIYMADSLYAGIAMSLDKATGVISEYETSFSSGGVFTVLDTKKYELAPDDEGYSEAINKILISLDSYYLYFNLEPAVFALIESVAQYDAENNFYFGVDGYQIGITGLGNAEKGFIFLKDTLYKNISMTVNKKTGLIYKYTDISRDEIAPGATGYKGLDIYMPAINEMLKSIDGYYKYFSLESAAMEIAQVAARHYPEINFVLDTDAYDIVATDLLKAGRGFIIVEDKVNGISMSMNKETGVIYRYSDTGREEIFQGTDTFVLAVEQMLESIYSYTGPIDISAVIEAIKRYLPADTVIFSPGDGVIIKVTQSDDPLAGVIRVTKDDVLVFEMDKQDKKITDSNGVHVKGEEGYFEAVEAASNYLFYAGWTYSYKDERVQEIKAQLDIIWAEEFNKTEVSVSWGMGSSVLVTNVGDNTQGKIELSAYKGFYFSLDKESGHMRIGSYGQEIREIDIDDEQWESARKEAIESIDYYYEQRWLKELLVVKAELNKYENVDKSDLYALADAFGSVDSDEKYNPVFDIDNDGDVDGADLSSYNRDADTQQETLVLPATVQMSGDGSEVSLRTDSGDYVVAHSADSKLWVDLSEADGEKVTFIAKVVKIEQRPERKYFSKKQSEAVNILQPKLKLVDRIISRNAMFNLNERRKDFVAQSI